MKKLLGVLLFICALSLCFTACGGEKNLPASGKARERFDKAITFIENRDYEAAYKILNKLKNYQEAKDELERFRFVPVTAASTRTKSGKTGKETMTFHYNEQNLLNQTVTIKNAQLLSYSTDYEFNADGEAISQCTDFIYDEIGNLTKTIHNDFSNPKTVKTIEYIRDENGILTKSITTYESGRQSIYEYSGDETKLPLVIDDLVDDIHIENGIIAIEFSKDVVGKLTCTYDKNKNLSECVLYYGPENKLVRPLWNLRNFAAHVYHGFTDDSVSGIKNLVKYVSEYRDPELTNTVNITYQLVYIPHDISTEAIDHVLTSHIAVAISEMLLSLYRGFA